MKTQINGAALAAPSTSAPVGQAEFFAILGELFERIGLLEGRLDDVERERDGQDRRIAAIREDLQRLT